MRSHDCTAQPTIEGTTRRGAKEGQPVLAEVEAILGPGPRRNTLINPERLAQIAEAALDAGDPLTLDFATLTDILMRLRAGEPYAVPDLSDELFEHGIEFVMSGMVPNPDSLMELANYLFTQSRLAQQPEPNNSRKTYTVGAVSFSNIGETRSVASPDDVLIFLAAAERLLARTDSVNLDPVTAYAMAYQILPKKRELASDGMEKLEQILQAIQVQHSAEASQVQALLGAEPPFDLNADPAIRSFRLVGSVRSAMTAGRFAQARDILQTVDERPLRSEGGWLIDFAEAVQAIREKDLERATGLANRLPPGVKRSLLNAGIAGSGADFPTARMTLGMGLKDAEQFSHEQRMSILPALAAAALSSDADFALMVVGLTIGADNDALASPRRSKFDPKADSPFDGPRVLFGPGGIYESVDMKVGRQTFTLKVPGVAVYSLRSFLVAARTLEFSRLEAAVAGLRNETHLAKALVALVDLRFSSIKP